MKLMTFIALSFFWVATSCTKNEPELQFISATALPNGSVELKAKVITKGSRVINGCGFGYSTEPNFEIQEHRTVTLLDGDEFSVIYPPGTFAESTVYHFRAYVLTASGYTQSDIKSIGEVIILPVEAPCAHPLNRYRIFSNNPFYAIHGTTNVSSGFNSVEYSNFIDPAGSIRVRFRTPPVTGIYTISEMNEPELGTAKLSIGWPNPSEGVAGGQIYVNKISNTQFSVEACAIQWRLTPTTVTTMDLNWVCNY